MLPFLRKKKEGSMAGEVDADDGMDLLDAISEDMIDAVHKKDKKRLRQALESYQEHLANADEKQDQMLMGDD